MNVYFDITDGNEEEDLPISPHAIWLILSLEVVVELGDESFLLIMQTNYASRSFSPIQADEGYWYCPFSGYKIGDWIFPPPTKKDLLEKCNELLGRINEAEEVRRVAYTLGIVASKPIYKGYFLELKTAPTAGGAVRAYLIRRYALTSMPADSIRNITDPEYMKGHAFLPLDRAPEVLHERNDLLPGVSLLTYQGKPLNTNLARCLRDPGIVNTWKRQRIQTSSEDWTRQEEGLLLSFDVRGYGALFDYIRREMPTFLQTAAEVANEFRTTLAQKFQRLASRAGVNQLLYQGDGFIAALPMRRFGDESWETIALRFLEDVGLLIDELDRMSDRVSAKGVSLKTRTCLLRDSYYYGRVGGPEGNGSSIYGEALRTLNRMDSGLKAAITSEASKITDHRHLLAVQPWTAQNILPRRSFNFLERMRVTAKEKTVEVDVCAFVRPRSVGKPGGQGQQRSRTRTGPPRA